MSPFPWPGACVGLRRGRNGREGGAAAAGAGEGISWRQTGTTEGSGMKGGMQREWEWEGDICRGSCGGDWETSRVCIEQGCDNWRGNGDGDVSSSGMARRGREAGRTDNERASKSLSS